MEFPKSDTTNFWLFSEWSRMLNQANMLESEHEKMKFSLNPTLALTEERMKIKHSISRELQKLEDNFAKVNDEITLIKKFKIELDTNIIEELNNLYKSFYSEENLAKQLIEHLDADINSITDSAEKMTEEIKEKLKNCINKNLPRSNDQNIDMLFKAEDAYEIIAFFNNEQEFIKQANIKINQPNTQQAYELLAKACAIKSVDELLTDKIREKEVKKHLQSIMPCIKECNQFVESFISNNTYEITNVEKEILQQLTNKNQILNSIIPYEKSQELARIQNASRNDDLLKQSSQRIKQNPQLESSKLVLKS